MAAYQTEEEQLASIKHWWESNGKFVIIGLFVVIASVIGTRTWQNFELSNLTKASAQYDLMMKELEVGKFDSVIQRGTDIEKSSPDLQYAVLAALVSAKVAVEKGNNDTALERLNWAMQQTSSDKMKHIIRVRLAKVLLAQNELAQALTHASFAEPGVFRSQYDIVKGDIYVKKGEIESAKAAYTLALADSNLGAQLKGFVQMKLDDLGVTEAGE